MYDSCLLNFTKTNKKLNKGCNFDILFFILLLIVSNVSTDSLNHLKIWALVPYEPFLIAQYTECNRQVLVQFEFFMVFVAFLHTE